MNVTSNNKLHFISNLRELLDMIKFEHTVFALPFALLGALATVRQKTSRGENNLDEYYTIR